MSGVFFNDRKGQTVLSNQELRGLKFQHITTMKELDELEQSNINSGLLWLSSSKKDILNEDFLRRVHKKLFGDVWKWAGRYRTTEKNIGILAYNIPSELKKLFEDTKFWIENNSFSPIELIARFHHRLVYIHPFPNGNGRLSRIYTNLLCEQIGAPKPTWRDDLAPVERRKAYISALRAADMKNFKPLIEYLS